MRYSYAASKASVKAPSVQSLLEGLQWIFIPIFLSNLSLSLNL